MEIEINKDFEQWKAEREQIIQNLIEILQNLPKKCLPSQICAEALNRMAISRGAIVQIRVLPSFECKTPYGI